MREQAFEARFGELRSLLQQRASQERFDVLVGVLSSMSRQEPERFDAEVLPYARAGLERWYASAPRGECVLSGRLAEAAVQGRVRWLGLVRALDLSEVGGGSKAWEVLCGEEVALPMLERLILRQKASARLVERLLGSAQAQTLTSLYMSQPECAGLLALRKRPLEGLRALELVFSPMQEDAAAALMEGLPGLETLRLDYCKMERGSAERVLAGAGRLSALSMGEWELREGGWRAVEALLVGMGEGLKLGAPRCLGCEEAIYGSDARGLVAFETPHALEGGARWALDRLLCGGALGRGLRQVALPRAGVSDEGAESGSEALESLSLPQGPSAEALRWVARGAWPALKRLEVGGSLSMGALDVALSAELPALRELEVRSHELDAARWRALWTSPALAQLTSMTLAVYRQQPELDVGLMVAAVDAMPALTSLYCYEGMWTPAARAQLVGTRAGALCGLG